MTGLIAPPAQCRGARISERPAVRSARAAWSACPHALTRSRAHGPHGITVRAWVLPVVRGPRRRAADHPLDVPTEAGVLVEPVAHDLRLGAVPRPLLGPQPVAPHASNVVAMVEDRPGQATALVPSPAPTTSTA